MSLMKKLVFGSLYIVHWCCFWTSDTACDGDTSGKLIFDLEGRNPSTINTITWDFTSQNTNITEFMANFSNGRFFAAPSFSNRLYHLSKNGTDVVNLNLSQLSTADAGTYECHILAGLQIITLKPFKLRLYKGATPNPLSLKTSEINDSATKTTICRCTGINTQGDVTEVQLIMVGSPRTIVARTKETSLNYTFGANDTLGNYTCHLVSSLSGEVCTTLKYSGNCEWKKPKCDWSLKISEIHDSRLMTTTCQCMGNESQENNTEVLLMKEGNPNIVVARTNQTSLSYMFRNDDEDGNYICVLESFSETTCTMWNHSRSCQWQKPKCDSCLYLTITLAVVSGLSPIFSVVLYFLDKPCLNGSGKGIRPKDILLILLLNITYAFITLTTVICFISCRTMGKPVSPKSSLYKLVITFATLGSLEIFLQ